MKKHIISFVALSLMAPIGAFAANSSATITVRGTVVDENNEPVVSAYVYTDNKNGAITELDGKFELTVPADATIIIETLGYEKQTLSAKSDFGTIKLTPSNEEIDIVVVSTSKLKAGDSCGPKPDLHIKKGKYKRAGKGFVCVPISPDGCEDKYYIQNNKCVEKTAESEKCTTKYTSFNNTTKICTYKTQKPFVGANGCSVTAFAVISDLQDSLKSQNNSEFADWKNACKNSASCNHAIEMQWSTTKENGYTLYTCEPKTCMNLYPTKTANGCMELSDGAECAPLDTNATTGKYNATTQRCESMTCKSDDYEPVDGVCLTKQIASPDKIDTRDEDTRAQALAEKQSAYDAAKAKENSFANKALTSVSTITTGIGGMELAQGLSEQRADKEAEEKMAEYIETMQCTYGNGKLVKAGLEEIELPGGNDEQMMNLRAEYFSTAQGLAELKNSLGMKPGIESEIILNKTEMGLYDDENTGISDGKYASLYRANMLNSESDKDKIAADKKASKNRVIGGAIAAGSGVLIGVVGNSVINGKLGDLLKQSNAGKETKALLQAQQDALKDLQKCMKDAGVQNSDKLKFEQFFPSVLSVANIKCNTELATINGKSAKTLYATNLFADSSDATTVFNKILDSFGPGIASKMIGSALSATPTDAEKSVAIDVLNEAMVQVQQAFLTAAQNDKTSAESKGISIEDLSGILSDKGISSDLLKNFMPAEQANPEQTDQGNAE